MCSENRCAVGDVRIESKHPETAIKKNLVKKTGESSSGQEAILVVGHPAETRTVSHRGRYMGILGFLVKRRTECHVRKAKKGNSPPLPTRASPYCQKRRRRLAGGRKVGARGGRRAQGEASPTFGRALASQKGGHLEQSGEQDVSTRRGSWPSKHHAYGKGRKSFHAWASEWKRAPLQKENTCSGRAERKGVKYIW